jgi:hypothetical protein
MIMMLNNVQYMYVIFLIKIFYVSCICMEKSGIYDSREKNKSYITTFKAIFSTFFQQNEGQNARGIIPTYITLY